MPAKQILLKSFLTFVMISTAHKKDLRHFENLKTETKLDNDFCLYYVYVIKKRKNNR